MIRQTNGLALEVTADGLFLGGDDTFREEIEQLATHARQELGITRTPRDGGWPVQN